MDGYLKPNSPVKGTAGILSHDNVPISNSSVIMNGKFEEDCRDWIFIYFSMNKYVDLFLGN